MDETVWKRVILRISLHFQQPVKKLLVIELKFKWSKKQICDKMVEEKLRIISLGVEKYKILCWRIIAGDLIL